VKPVEKAPPAELDPSFHELLGPQALEVGKDGKVAFEFWLVREVSLNARPASNAQGLDAVSQTTVLGALRVPEERRDYRDHELFAGVYTLRMSFQPQDGDHLGTSDFLYFLTLIPAKADPSPVGIETYKAMVKASGKETPSGHPVILSLRPVSEKTTETPVITEPASEHTALRVRIPARIGTDGERAELVFDLVVEGTATLH
jgi:hypothetical protein